MHRQRSLHPWAVLKEESTAGKEEHTWLSEVGRHRATGTLQDVGRSLSKRTSNAHFALYLENTHLQNSGPRGLITVIIALKGKEN